MSDRNLVNETLTGIHHQCAEIQRQVVLCLENGRVGTEWLLKMQHSQGRIKTLMVRLEK